MNFKKKLLYILTAGVILCLAAFNCSALSVSLPVSDVIADEEGRLLCMSHRGDTAEYPANSLEAVLSAWQKGADMVSVSVQKTKDGVFLLCEDDTLGNICDSPFEKISEAVYDDVKESHLFDNTGKLTEYKLSSLDELLGNTDLRLYLVLDIEWEDREGVYEILKRENALERAALRIEESAKKISEWVKEKEEKVAVIGIYDGNIIWNSISHINILSECGMELVQYQSKNYFNVMYGSWTTDRFSSEGFARAVAPCYNPDLCGQRSDSEDGWNELIKMGFTVIETNNPAAFSDYIEKNTKMRKELSVLTEKARAMDTEKYSSTSKDNLKKGIKNAEMVLSGRVKSLDETENAYSKLLFYMNEMKISVGEETTKGALNITAGKVIAAVLVGALIFAGQIFVHKYHRKKENKI